LYNSLEDAYPCIGIDLCASGLAEDESSKSHTIHQFFTKSKDTNAHCANGATNVKQLDEKKPALFFFHNNKQATEETYLCDKCNQFVPIASIEEHSDYHFALDLSNEDRQQLPQKRKTSSNLTKEEKKQKRSLFFTKRQG
jgi:DNA polymerase eta